MASFREFFNRKKAGNGQEIHWGRLSEDGVPFRGQPSLLTDEEYERRVRRSRDAQAEFFDVSDAKQKKQYLRVLDGIVNGLYTLLHIERFIRPDTHYIEWVETFMEDTGRSS